MGPIEITFLCMAAILTVVGVVRGYGRELGVTTMLLVVLLVIEFTEAMAGATLDGILVSILGSAAAQRDNLKALIWCGMLVTVIIVSYHGETLSFDMNGRNPPLSLAVGLLNGYLFAGSLWYFLGRAGWPYMSVNQNYTALYNTMWRWLPPALLDWPYLLALVAAMLVLKVWK
jgi:hypothetical protein